MSRQQLLQQVIGVMLVVLYSVGCVAPGPPAPAPPTPEPLAPPIIGAPIHDCAQIIAYSGASNDAEIVVYINGTEETRHKTWLGWGEIRLPAQLKLKSGDSVAAAQVVGTRMSDKTREPEKVEDIPSIYLNQEQLPKPQIMPPLYKCQQSIRIGNILESANVVLRDQDANTYRGTTPYKIIWMGVPSDESVEWYTATQHMCGEEYAWPSEWSDKGQVDAPPEPMPTPVIREPIVSGNDACTVDYSIPGATVDIYDGDNNRVGGGIALEPSTIYRISPPLDASMAYTATQSLCNVESDPSPPAIPSEDVPPPSVQRPICVEDFYVTVCDTVERSTVHVYVTDVGGEPKQVTEAGGNGGCVTIALGNKTVFQPNQDVSAVQNVDGKPSPRSAAVPVEGTEMCRVSCDPISMLNPSERAGIVHDHNKTRKGLGIPDLTWSHDLACHAQEWADHLASINAVTTDQFQHSQSGYGENMFAGTGNYTTAEVVQEWVSEAQWYDYATNTCSAPPDESCGHYTQVVWKNTKFVGCGKAQGSDGWEIWVCNYDPPGNIVGEWPY
jgi:pathogenesis-related protein 1